MSDIDLEIARKLKKIDAELDLIRTIETPIVGAGAAHNVLSATHIDSTAAAAVQGDVIRAEGTTPPLWTRYPIGTHWQLFGVNAGQDAPEWQAFDWGFHVIAAGGDGVHDHSGNPEGGVLPAAAPAAHDQNANTIIIPSGMGTPTYDDVQDFLNLGQSSGRLTGGALTAHAGPDGTLDISAMEGMIHTANTLGSPLIYFKKAAVASLALTDNAVNYIIITYTAPLGVPTLTYSTSATRPADNTYNAFVVGRVWRATNNVEPITTGQNIYDMYGRQQDRLLTKYGAMDHASGGIISAHATALRLTCTAGVWYFGNSRIDTPSVGHVGDKFYVWYKTGGGAWTESGLLTLFSEVFNGGGGNKVYETYQNGTSLGALTANFYGVYWIFTCPEGDLYVVLGDNKYANIGAAQAASVPASLPPYCVNWARLIGRVIIKNSAAAFYSVESVFITQFQLSAATDHASLFNLAWASSAHIGMASRVAAFDVAGAAISGALIPPATNVLTLTATAASTLGLAIDAGKTLTLTAADTFNLTIPATGIAALLGTANAFTAAQTIISTTALQLKAGYSSSKYFTADVASTGITTLTITGDAGAAFVFNSPLKTTSSLLAYGNTTLGDSSADAVIVNATITSPVNILSTTAPQLVVGYDADPGGSYFTATVADTTGVTTLTTSPAGGFVITPPVTFSSTITASGAIASTSLATASRFGSTTITLDDTSGSAGPFAVSLYTKSLNNGTYHNRMANLSLRMAIADGVVDSGPKVGLWLEAMRNYPGVADGTGTLTTLTALNLLVGHFNDVPATSPTTTTATALSFSLNYKTGTIGTLQGINIGEVSGGTATALYAIRSQIASASGHYNLYIDGAGQNYIAGSVGVGVVVAATKLHVIATTEQLRLGYDAASYMSVTVADTTGVVTFNAIPDSGTGSFVFTPPVTITGVLTASSNVGIGTTVFGTSAAKVLGIGNGTEPSTSPADMVQLYSVDLSAGNATLGLRTETAVVTETVTSDRTLSIRINGTTYKVCLKA